MRRVLFPQHNCATVYMWANESASGNISASCPRTTIALDRAVTPKSIALHFWFAMALNMCEHDRTEKQSVWLYIVVAIVFVSIASLWFHFWTLMFASIEWSVYVHLSKVFSTSWFLNVLASCSSSVSQCCNLRNPFTFHTHLHTNMHTFDRFDQTIRPLLQR